MSASRIKQNGCETFNEGTSHEWIYKKNVKEFKKSKFGNQQYLKNKWLFGSFLMFESHNNIKEQAKQIDGYHSVSWVKIY